MNVKAEKGKRDRRGRKTMTLGICVRIILLAIALCFLPIGVYATEIVIPEGTEVIEAEAFENCSSVQTVVIPDSVTEIGEDAFLNCGEALLICAGAGSAGANYAKTHQLDYMAGTEYRALIIYQTYPGTSMALQGPATDQKAMTWCLRNLTTTPFNVRVEGNLSADGIISAIVGRFADANEDDVSLFYYSGHGDENGNLLGADRAFSLLSPTALRNALDAVPGRKIVIVDACYSGKLIEEESEPKRGGLQAAHDRNNDSTKEFVNAFQSAFRPKTRGALNVEEYFVITAARETEESGEGLVDSGGSSVWMGYFTFGLCLGCGWDSPKNQTCELNADVNGDSAVSIQEVYQYARNIALDYNNKQSAAVWPEDCKWFAPFRR